MVGQTKNNAESILKAHGFNVSISTQSVSGAAAGTVVSQTPSAGAEATEGMTISLTVASGAKEKDDKNVKDNRQNGNTGDTNKETPVPNGNAGKGK